MRILLFLLPFVLMTGAGAPAFAQSAEAEAKASLENLKAIAAKEDNWRKLGLRSPQDIDTVALGMEFTVLLVGLHDLQRYSGDPDALLQKTGQHIVPLVREGQALAGIFVEMYRGKWRTTGFGGPNLVRRLEQTRQVVSRQENAPERDFFAVHVAALGQYFLGRNTPQGLRLTPILSDAQFGFKAGQTMWATDVFSKLQPAALKHNGEPM